MRMFKPMQRLATCLFVVVFMAPAWAAQDDPLSRAIADFWSDPVFLKKFLGSYTVSDTDPKITPDENKILKNVLDQLKTSPEAAANSLQKQITESSSAALDFTLAKIHVQLGKLDLAAQNYLNAIKKFKEFAEAHKDLGIIYAVQQNHKEALPHLTRALELGQESGSMYGAIGLSYLALNQYVSAEAAYSKALVFEPDDVNWKLGIAQATLGQQKYKEAAALFAELLQKEPEEKQYWLAQANAYINLGEPLKALGNYEILRRMGKADAQILNSLGDIYVNQGMLELAGQAYLESVEKDSSQRELSRVLRAMEALITRGATESASALIQRIKPSYAQKLTDPDKLRILRSESQIAMITGSQEQAVQALEQIIERDPLDGQALLLLAGFYGKKGQLEKAEILFERAAKLRDHQVRAYIQHAQFLVGQKKYDKAVKLLQQAQAIQPNDRVQDYLDNVQRVARLAR